MLKASDLSKLLFIFYFQAYQDLRCTLPEQYRGCDTKLDLLRGAVEYIRHLQKCLTNDYEGTSAERVGYVQSFTHIIYNE
ncbi:Hypp2613 [Branchiostoma lanceolatum]|uniref:Hypp2613 protein n=1 Tax=Branchiostoma lanceolatum TaxID=7740 RepID=A0A8K0ETP6_BRALA|nr:Hypp2613 [Branchiostoma lanceolatum]